MFRGTGQCRWLIHIGISFVKVKSSSGSQGEARTVLGDWLLERCWGMNDVTSASLSSRFRDSLGLVPLYLPGAVGHRAGPQDIFVTPPWNSARCFCTPSLGHTQEEAVSSADFKWPCWTVGLQRFTPVGQNSRTWLVIGLLPGLAWPEPCL